MKSVSDNEPAQSFNLKKMGRLAREIWKLLAAHKRSILFLAGLVAVQAGLNVGGAAALKYFMDGLEPGLFGRVYLAIPLAVAGVLVMLAYLNYGVSLLADMTGERIVADLREDTFEKFLGFSQSFLDASHSASLSSRLINDLGWVRQAIRHLYREGFSEPAVILALGGYLAYLNAGLFFFSLVVLPLFAFPVWLLGRRAGRLAQDLTDHHAERAAVQQESLASAAVIRASGAGSVFSKRFSEMNRKVLGTWISLYKTSGLMHPVSMTLAGVVFACVSVVGYRGLTAGALSPGTYGAFLGGLVLFFRASARLGHRAASFIETLGALDRIIGLRERTLAGKKVCSSCAPGSSLESGGGGVLSTGDTISIRVEGLGFRYGESGPMVLENLDLLIEPGDFVALLGESGSGKSTLLKLILGFYLPVRGKVLLNGCNPAEMTSETVSELVGYLDQEAALFDDTIRFNVSLGRKADDREVWQALKGAGLARFVENLPEGLDTRIGESGHRISMGERRRLALARCLLLNPPVLLLDEPTSSLDRTTASKVMEYIEKSASDGKVVLMATHQSDMAARARKTLCLGNISAQTESFDLK